MKRMPAIGLLFSLCLGLAEAGTTPPACASLCGEWRLDVAASDKPEQLLDAAFQQFREPKVRRPHMPNTDNLEALGRAADEEALGPILDRPRSKELREELQRALQQPRGLAISANAEDIRISGDGASPRSMTPGEHSSRVDLLWHGAHRGALARRAAGGERKIRPTQPAGNHLRRCAAMARCV